MIPGYQPAPTIPAADATRPAVKSFPAKEFSVFQITVTGDFTVEQRRNKRVLTSL